MKAPFAKFDKNGEPSKSGSLESAAALWFYKFVDGEIFVLFQKRAASVDNGGFYDMSSGGHLDKGESPLSAALRETREEIGISVSPDEVYYLLSSNVGKKIIHYYLSDRTEKDDVFTLDPSEVESLEWIALKDFDNFIQSRGKPPLRKNVHQLALLKDYLTSKAKES